MYDHLGDYTAAFLVAGIPPIVGACLMFLIYRVDGHKTPDAESAGAECADAAGSASGLTGSATKTTIVAEEDTSAAEKESLLKA
jgi:hypothetical protein